jgi:hypothetical protein
VSETESGTESETEPDAEPDAESVSRDEAGSAKKS